MWKGYLEAPNSVVVMAISRSKGTRKIVVTSLPMIALPGKTYLDPTQKLRVMPFSDG